MSNLSQLTILGLATYRLTKLVIEDQITASLRDKVFEKFDPSSTKLGYFITCPWCVSIWAAGALVVLDKVSPEFGKVTQKVLAASAITGLVDTHV